MAQTPLANKLSWYGTSRPEKFGFMQGGKERATGTYRDICEDCERRSQRSRKPNFDGSRLLIKIFALLLLWPFLLPIANAHNRNIDLIISYKMVNFAGKSIQAIAVNNQIPAPTLHFAEGDHVTINVYNHLDQGTSIHWHGLLVPWDEDGTAGISQKPIPPNGVFHYHFTLKQSGTYWYHAHAELQEQRGLYGGIIIDPIKPTTYRYTKDYVIVLSDWSNTLPEKILANLKKDGDYYSPRFSLQPSLARFIHDYNHASPTQRKNIVAAYKMMQQMRMSIYDISDVVYDTFLLNGYTNKNPWTAQVKVGDIVRLRFIDAAGSTIFHVKMPQTIMQIIHIQGNDIHPYNADNFTIAPGETYDILVKIQHDIPYAIYAESADTLGMAYGGLLTNPTQKINYKNITPFPIPGPITMGHDMDHMPNESRFSGHGTDRPEHSMQTSSNIDYKTTGTKYQDLVAIHKTNDPNKPVHIIKMNLYGFMGHYIWFINGVPEYKAKPIIIEPGQRYRILFINDSMMHHPMHIHGHWFILRNGHGAHDPLLHTIDVPPNATVVADVDANASGQWFFHCHHLYHMKSGMARVLQYAPFIKDPANSKETQELIRHPMGHATELYLANFLDIGFDLFHKVQKITFKGLFGGDYNKLELFANDMEINKSTLENADLDVFYWHLISEFWAIKAGINYFYRPTNTPYLQPGIGIEGLMPYFIDTDARIYYHNNSTKLDLELSRDTQITNNFFIRIGLRGIFATKTVADNEIGSGLNQVEYKIRPFYRLYPGVVIFAELDHDQDYGVFKNLQKNKNEKHIADKLFLGISVLF